MNDTFENISFTSDNFHQQFKNPNEFMTCTFKDLDLNGLNFTLSKFLDCHFVNCNLSNVQIKNAALRSCKFTDCKLIGIDWSSTQTLALAVFKKSLLDYCIFNSMTLKKSSFINCSLKEADFNGCNLAGSDFTGARLVGANFSRADLSMCDFRMATEYSFEPTYTNISKAKFSAPEVLALLKSFDISIE